MTKSTMIILHRRCLCSSVFVWRMERCSLMELILGTTTFEKHFLADYSVFRFHKPIILAFQVLILMPFNSPTQKLHPHNSSSLDCRWFGRSKRKSNHKIRVMEDIGVGSQRWIIIWWVVVVLFFLMFLSIMDFWIVAYRMFLFLDIENLPFDCLFYV